MRDKTGLLAATLRERIRDGAYKAGSALPSERHLVDEFKVSRTTIRRALAALAEDGMVRAQAGSGTFVQDTNFIPAIGPGATRAVQLIVPTLSDPYYGELVEAVGQELRRHGLSLIAARSDYSVETETDMLAQAAGDPIVCACIVVPSSVAAPSAGALAFTAAGKPLVYLGRWPEDGHVADRIGTDYRQAAFLATQHLLARGHRRVAYIEGRPHLPGFSPREGHAAAFAAAGIALPPELVRILELPSEVAGEQGVAALLQRMPAFTAVLARNDVTAMGVLRALRAAGLRVPQDVAVASINNSLFARSADPPLTSVDPFPHVVGRMAARLVQDRLEGLTTGPAVQLSVGSALIVRASTAAAPASQRRRATQPA